MFQGNDLPVPSTSEVRSVLGHLAEVGQQVFYSGLYGPQCGDTKKSSESRPENTKKSGVSQREKLKKSDIIPLKTIKPKKGSK